MTIIRIITSEYPKRKKVEVIFETGRSKKRDKDLWERLDEFNEKVEKTIDKGCLYITI